MKRPALSLDVGSRKSRSGSIQILPDADRRSSSSHEVESKRGSLHGSSPSRSRGSASFATGSPRSGGILALLEGKSGEGPIPGPPPVLFSASRTTSLGSVGGHKHTQRPPAAGAGGASPPVVAIPSLGGKLKMLQIDTDAERIQTPNYTKQRRNQNLEQRLEQRLANLKALTKAPSYSSLIGSNQTGSTASSLSSFQRSPKRTVPPRLDTKGSPVARPQRARGGSHGGGSRGSPSSVGSRGTKFESSVSAQDMLTLKPIGRGQNGSVFMALHLPLFRLTAIKEMNIYMKSARLQLIKELRAFAKTRHRNIVEFFGAYFDQGDIVIALEYMNGGSLAQCVERNGALSERVTASVITQALRGLGKLHEVLIVHGDIKPENILINLRGEAKISDFGLAREVDPRTKTVAGAGGTVIYLSPERIKGQPFSFPSDIWSIGITMYYLLTNSIPYQSDDYWGYASEIVSGQSPQLDQKRFSSAAAEFLETTLRKSPGSRDDVEKLLKRPFASDELIPRAEWGLQRDEKDMDRVTEAERILRLVFRKLRERDAQRERETLTELDHTDWGDHFELISDMVSVDDVAFLASQLGAPIEMVSSSIEALIREQDAFSHEFYGFAQHARAAAAAGGTDAEVLQVPPFGSAIPHASFQQTGLQQTGLQQMGLQQMGQDFRPGIQSAESQHLQDELISGTGVDLGRAVLDEVSAYGKSPLSSHPVPPERRDAHTNENKKVLQGGVVGKRLVSSRSITLPVRLRARPPAAERGAGALRRAPAQRNAPPAARHNTANLSVRGGSFTRTHSPGAAATRADIRQPPAVQAPSTGGRRRNAARMAAANERAPSLENALDIRVVPAQEAARQSRLRLPNISGSLSPNPRSATSTSPARKQRRGQLSTSGIGASARPNSTGGGLGGAGRRKAKWPRARGGSRKGQRS